MLLGFATAVGIPAQPANAANLNIRGSIRNFNGELVPNAELTVQVGTNPSFRLTAGADGRFSVQAPSGALVSTTVHSFVDNYDYRRMLPFIASASSTAHFIEGYKVSLPPTKLGTPGRDVISGTSGRDVIIALAGNDTVTTLGGNDVVIGGAGNDIIRLGGGTDEATGGEGNDQIFGGAQNDRLLGLDDDDNIDGGGGNDDLRGDAGSDLVLGGPGTDTIQGDGHGASIDDFDTVRGGDGGDSMVASRPAALFGEGGDDTISLNNYVDFNSTADCGIGTDRGIRNSGQIPDSAYTSCERIDTYS